ncbi:MULTISPECIES: hypothetical protein [Fischerella]|nr:MULTISPECIES: hypothetical protein [Fischerella]
MSSYKKPNTRLRENLFAEDECDRLFSLPLLCAKLKKNYPTLFA